MPHRQVWSVGTAWTRTEDGVFTLDRGGFFPAQVLICGRLQPEDTSGPQAFRSLSVANRWVLGGK